MTNLMFLIVSLILTAAIIIFQLLPLQGFAQNIPITRTFYSNTRKGIEKLYRIDNTLRFRDKTGNEVSVPSSLLNKEDIGYNEVRDAILDKIQSLQNENIVGFQVVLTAQARRKFTEMHLVAKM